LGAGGDVPGRVESTAVDAFEGFVLIGEKENNNGSYFVTLMKLEAKKRRLPLVLKGSLRILVLLNFLSSSD